LRGAAGEGGAAELSSGDFVCVTLPQDCCHSGVVALSARVVLASVAAAALVCSTGFGLASGNLVTAGAGTLVQVDTTDDFAASVVRVAIVA
jgi:hypothetical protein